MRYITKKITEPVARKLYRVKYDIARKMEKRVTDSEVIDMALSELEKKPYATLGSLSNLIGRIKGGKKSTAKEIDELVYGG